MTSQRSPRNPYVRQLLRDPLVLPFYLPALLLFVGAGLTTPILPLYAEDFGVRYAWVGAFMSAQALGMLFSELPGGLLLRRLGRKTTMLLGAGVMVAAQFGYFLAPSIQVAFAFRLVAGFGSALYGVARHAYVAAHTQVASRGRAMALFGGLMRVSKFVGPPIGGVLAAALGLRVPFLISGVVSSTGILALLLFVRGGKVAARTGAALHARALRSVVRNTLRRLLPAGLGYIFVAIIRTGRDTILPLYAANALGMEVETIGWMMGIAAALETVMFIPGGWIMDHLGRKYVLVPSFAIQAAAMACVPLTGGFAGLLLCASAIGMGNGLTSGAMMTLGADLAPPDARGEFLSVWRLIGDVGGIGGPSVVGFVADSLALPTAALALAASGALAVLTFGLLLPETLRKT